MSDLMLVQNENGYFEKYNPEHDMTIHFETAEEQENFIEEVQKAFKALDKIEKIQFVLDCLSMKTPSDDHGHMKSALVEIREIMEE